MLRWVFEAETFGLVYEGVVVACEEESGEIAVEESAVVIADDCEGSWVVGDAEGEVVVGFERVLGQLELGRVVVRETDGGLPETQFQNQQTGQQNGLHAL